MDLSLHKGTDMVTTENGSQNYCHKVGATLLSKKMTQNKNQD